MATAAKNRLTGIEVLEMSVVDKGANKRKWLLCKREGGEPGDEDVKMPAEFLKLMGDLNEFLKTASNKPAANDPGTSPPGPTQAAFDELVKTSAGLGTQIADLTKSIGYLKAIVEKQAEAISTQAGEIKKASDTVAAAEKTIGELRGLVNEQAEVIKRAKLAKVGNSTDADGNGKRPETGEKQSSGFTWPTDLNEGRTRA